jgi:outer membrane protein assembly factor BamB
MSVMRNPAILLAPFVAFAIEGALNWPAPHHAPAPTVVDWPRFGYDIARTSAPHGSTGLTASSVASLRRTQVAIDGAVDASAIYLHGASVRGAAHNALFVTTTYGKTIAIDADSGTILWEYTPESYRTLGGTYRITTATPVADPDRTAIYAASPDGMIQKLAVADGRVLWRSMITRYPEREKIASPLNFDGGHIIATTGGYIGDAPPYQGHVAILDPASGRLLHVWNALCSDKHEMIDPASCSESGSAIWGRAGAVIDPSTGDIFVATGNGRWDGRTHWGDAVIELDADATRILGNYTPTNTADLDAGDTDLGSTAPALIGGFVVQGGKDRQLRVLEWKSMKGVSPHKGGERSEIPTPSGTGLFTALAVLATDTGTYLFAADKGGTQAFAMKGGALTSMWKAENAGTSPVVSDGMAFVYDPGGKLHVFDAMTGRSLATYDCGDGHWNSPIVVDGKIILPTGSGRSGGTIEIFR